MYDVVIIGGGIVGCSIARELSKNKLNILVLEKNLEVCQETTKANSAIAHGGFDAVPGSLKARFNVRGIQMMEELSRELGFTYNKIGSMVLAFDMEELSDLEELYHRGLENGVKGLEIIDRERILETEAKVSDQVIGALYCPESGVIDPFNFCYSMIENAIVNGASLKTECEVIGLEEYGDYILVKTNDEEYRTKYVVNAAGLYSDKIANMAGDNEFHVIPTKGVYRLMDKTRSDFINTVIFQTPTEKGKGVLVTATYDGNTMIGPTSETIGKLEDTTTESQSLEMIDKLARKSVPNIDLSKTIRVFTGVRAKPNTGDFMVYRSKNMPKLVHAGGIESPGLVSAPAIAEYVVYLLAEAGLELEKKQDFNPTRKAIKRISQVDLDEKIDLIKENPNYGNIICRCETVSEAEILEAIHRPAGAKTVDGVKRRVRAGMGRCQGGFCGPRVLEILARELNVDPTEVQKEISGSAIVERHLKA